MRFLIGPALFQLEFLSVVAGTFRHVDLHHSDGFSLEMPHYVENQREGQRQQLQQQDNQKGASRYLTYDDLSALEKRWYMSKPEFSYHGYEIRLLYNISWDIEFRALHWAVFDGIDCSLGSNEIVDNNINDYLQTSLSDLSTAGLAEIEIESGSLTPGFRQIEVINRIDTDRIRFTPLYQDFGRFSQINFCVRLGAFHDEEGLNPVEVNWVETPVLLTMENLMFEIGGPSSFESVYSVYEARDVNAHICGDDSDVMATVEAQQEVRLCIQAGNNTLTEGGTLLYVEEFSFSRSNHTQQAIEPRTGGLPAPASAPLACDDNLVECHFVTALEPEFFSSAGIINGQGTAFIQFGEISNPTEGAVGKVNFEEVPEKTHGATRMVPVRFGLKMVALQHEDRSSGFLPEKHILTHFIVWTLGISCFLSSW